MVEILGFILVFLALSSGSFIGATFLNKKYGEMLPITCFFIIAFLYIFYILNILGIGFWILICLMIGCYVTGTINFLKNKERNLFQIFLILEY